MPGYKKHGPVNHAAPAWTSGGNPGVPDRDPCGRPGVGDGDENIKLANAISGCLRLADELGLASIAFPAISTGFLASPKNARRG